MPSTIPYDPSLVLGNIVTQERLDNVEKISKLQAPVDSAEATLNSFISLKRSLDLTIQEMINMGVDTEDLIKESNDVAKEMQKAAVIYGKEKLKSEKAILPLKAKIITIHDSIESPIDYNRSQLKKFPISTDSLQLNCQYFSFDENSQSSATHAATVAGYVSESLSIFGQHHSSQAASSAQAQMNSQHSRHSLSGTLVVSINCTHKNAQVFAPYYLNPDKAVNAWNALYPGDMIKTNDPLSIAKIQWKSQTTKEKTFSLLSGATYGSSFVAMVHILNTSRTDSFQHMESVAASLQQTFSIGGWFAHGTGGYGVDTSFSNSVKDMLSVQDIQSHCSVITVGIIPSIKSNQVALAVQEFADFDPAKAMESLATLQGATASEHNSIAQAASAARTGKSMLELKSEGIKSTLSGLSKIDDGQNKIIDINSVMTALDDYINRCVSGEDNIGVPINYYLKPVSQSEIARAWLAKYYPNQYNQAGSVDDSNSTGSGNSGAETTGGSATVDDAEDANGANP